MRRQTNWFVCLVASCLGVTSAWAQAPVQATNMAPLPQTAAQPANQPSGQVNIVSLPELQALVAPVALYPDALLAQMLMAATYPIA